MTTKTIKTILFASLIAAMILPFSGLNFADAKKAYASNTCDELIGQDNLKKIDKIDEELVKNIAKENKEYKKLESNEIQDLGVLYEGQVNLEDCTSEITDVTQTFKFVDKDNKSKKLSVTLDAKDYSVKKSEITDDEEIEFTFLGTQEGNWAGHSVRDHSGTSNVDRTLMYWDLPAASDPAGINCGTTGASRCMVAVWTGLTDTSNGNDVLSQLGTVSQCLGNNCSSGTLYYPFLQFWDDGSIQAENYCLSVPSSAGDSFSASMQYITSGTDRYYGYLYNLETGKICSQTRNEVEQPVYGQFIAERPQSGGSNTILAQFTDFPIQGYFYDSGVLQGLDEIDTTGYDYFSNVINTASNPFANANQPNSSDTFTANYIKSI